MAEEYEVMNHFDQNNRHGNFLIIKGKIRSGKTHLAAILARFAMEKGFTIITNIRFRDSVIKKYPDRIHYITSDREFFEAYVQIDGDSITIFDDAQATLSSSLDTQTAKGKLIQSLMLFIGKFQSNVIYIAHLKYLPLWIKSAQPLYIFKMHQKDMHISYDYLPFYEVRRSRNAIRIPLPSDLKPLPFKTFGFPNFEITLNLPRMWRELSHFEGDDMRIAVKKYLENEHKRDERDRLRSFSEEDIIKAIMLKYGYDDPKKFSKLKFHEVFKNLYKIRID